MPLIVGVVKDKSTLICTFSLCFFNKIYFSKNKKTSRTIARPGKKVIKIGFKLVCSVRLFRVCVVLFDYVRVYLDSDLIWVCIASSSKDH